MKTAIKSMSTALHRAILWFQLFAITTHIDGQTKLIDWMQDAGGDRRTIGNMLIARHHAKCEQARLQAAYADLLRPRRPSSWRLA